jgi:hypothetical protein
MAARAEFFPSMLDMRTTDRSLHEALPPWHGQRMLDVLRLGRQEVSLRAPASELPERRPLAAVDDVNFGGGEQPQRSRGPISVPHFLRAS